MSSTRPRLYAEDRFVLTMRSRASEEELAKIAGVKVTTVRRTAHELLELLERDLES